MTQKHAVQTAADFIRNHMGDYNPKLALMLGSGLGALTEQLDERIEISYADVPGFPKPTVEGHAGTLVFGQIGGVDVLFLNGRVHAYETNDFTPFKTLIRTVKALGVETLFTTSASGSLDRDMPPGSVMLITDHINMTGTNPLLGLNDDEFGPRFPDLGDAWSAKTRARFQKAADSHGVALQNGVYVGFRGPCFETHAEVRMAKLIGGNAVGMSAVPENILANHCGLTVAGCAVITNLAAGMEEEVLTHDGTLQGAKLAFEKLTTVLKTFVAQYKDA